MKTYLNIFLASLILCLVLTLFNALKSIFISSWVNSICFFCFTLLLLNVKSHNATINDIMKMTVSIILGYSIIPIFIHVIDFRGTYYSLLIWPITIVSVLLSAVCWYEKRYSVYVLSVIIMVMLNSIVQSYFLDYCYQYFNIPYK